MPGLLSTKAFHTDTDAQGRPLSAADREKLLKPYLPPIPPTRSASPSPARPHGKRSKFQHKRRVRPALGHLLHVVLFTVIHFIFSVYIRVRKAWHAVRDRVFAILYYHHRTPELIRRDVKVLSRLPGHLSVILELPDGGRKGDGLDALINDACEVAAWSASAGVPMLSIYERTGVLKQSLPHFHRRLSRHLTSYFGRANPLKPTISLRAPHIPSYSPPTSPDPANESTSGKPYLTIILISASDGRGTLVDLTKTLAEMSQTNKINPADISAELIDAEISESVMSEPDLLILFRDRVVLDGYPPWQIRLTEIFHVPDNAGGVGYQVFLRGLYKYANAEMRFGR